MIRIQYFIGVILSSFTFILFSTNVNAQHTILHGDTLVVDDGAKFWLNEELVFGSGTKADNSYTYIYEAPSGLQKIVAEHKRKSLSSVYKGSKSRIIKFEKALGHNKKGFDYTILVLEMPNGTKYWCDARNAYANHEIVSNTTGDTGAQLSKNDSKDDAGSVKDKKPASKKGPSKKKTSPSKETTIF